MRSNPLIRLTSPYVEIEFIHDGKPHRFYSYVNDLSGSRLTAFDSDPPWIDSEKAWIKSIVKDLKEKSQILKISGTKGWI